MSSVNNSNMAFAPQDQAPRIVRFKQKGMSFDLSERYEYKESKEFKKLLIDGLMPTQLVDEAKNPNENVRIHKQREKLKSQVFKPSDVHRKPYEGD